MAELLSMEKETPRMVSSKVVAAFLNVSRGWVVLNAEAIPGYLRCTAGRRNPLHRWDMNKVISWQQRQERERAARKQASRDALRDSLRQGLA